LQQFLADMAAAGKYFQMQSRFSCFSFSHGNKSQKFNYTVFGFFLLLPPVWCYWQQAL
jgi:hypothetical protein